MLAAGEVMLVAEEVMLAAVQTFACLPAASPSLPFCVPAWQGCQLLWPGAARACFASCVRLICSPRNLETDWTWVACAVRGLKLVLPLWPLSHQICQDDRTSKTDVLEDPQQTLDCCICAVASCLVASCLEKSCCDAFASPPGVQAFFSQGNCPPSVR